MTQFSTLTSKVSQIDSAYEAAVSLVGEVNPDFANGNQPIIESTKATKRAD